MSLRVVSEPPADGRPLIGTHDGHFHCDEALACAMLQMTEEFAGAAVCRTRNKDRLAQCNIVVDVGAEYDPERYRFDHHQLSFAGTMTTPEAEYKTRLSSAGLVYKHFGRAVVRKLCDPVSDADLDIIYDRCAAPPPLPQVPCRGGGGLEGRPQLVCFLAQRAALRDRSGCRQVHSNRRRLPSNHRRLPPNRRRLPFNRRRPPSNRRRPPSNRRRLPSNRRRLPPNRRRVPFNRRRLPFNRPRLSSNRRRVPSNRHRVPSNRRRVPSNRRRLPFNRRRLPTNRRRLPSNRHRLPSNRRR